MAKKKQPSAERHQFIEVPRGEFLVETVRQSRGHSLGDFVQNRSTRLADRLTLPVEDNSMAGAGIQAGDFVVVENGRYSEGDILAVQLGDKVVVRRYFRAARRIRLESAPPGRETIIIEADTPGVTILGRVVQVVKEM